LPPSDWKNVADEQLIEIATKTTPKQRLEWLEEALSLSGRAKTIHK
jgi:hypothetical protein